MRPLSALVLAALLGASGCSRADSDEAASTNETEASIVQESRAAGSLLDAAAASIVEADFMRRVGVLAHDSMRGRATPSPELDATAVWVAEELERMGVLSGTPEGFEQRYAVEVAGTLVEAPNVVGLIRGSDPELADEYLVFSAHMDHVGVGLPDANGDSIYNGADDDASGTAAVLELAEAFALLDPSPRRSLIFLFVSGEERGLWGSAYFADHPTVPIEAIVANLNIDMVGRNWPDTIVAIGKEHSDLGATLEQIAARHPELDMKPIDDLWPTENFYTRSDHYNFAKKGVPILFFFNGTHEDYHRPSDEPDKVDADKGSRIAKLVFYLGAEIANRDARPEWDPASYERITGTPP